MNRLAHIMIACGLLAFGCGKRKDEPAKEPVAQGSAGSGSAEAGSGSAGSGSAGSGSAVADEVEVPTEVDFEADATAKISDKNLEAEVKALEAELAQ